METLNHYQGSIIRINLEREKRLLSRIDDCIEFSDFATVLQDEVKFNSDISSVLFIDEAQESAVLGGFVRFMKEEWPKTRIILTGSTLTRLFRPNQRFPVGRFSRLLVTPFSFSEFLKCVAQENLCENLKKPGAISLVRHTTLLKELDRYLTLGGLPAVVAAYSNKEDWRRLRQELLAGYEDDFRRILKEDSMALVKAAFRAVSGLAGSAFKNSAVRVSLNSAQNEQVNSILERLEEWKIFLRSNQKGLSPESAIAYHPKRYFFDSGILRELRESAIPSIALLDGSDSSVRTVLGALIENQTAIELSRRNDSLTGFKKSSSGLEIDFIVKKGEMTFPVECKATLQIRGTHLKGVLAYLDMFNLKTGVVISLAPYGEIACSGNRKVINVPLYAAEHLYDFLLKN
ncbi:MAG: hypothetical protein A2293_08700 [Elusimicrobia bacterium RIFOXYB2_FULL_49_7]|nr:MAG: hypothetical protein A2293_08700 [Elusimicrobia bacterium RIFOXYB2_FULL_49_7]